MSAGTGVAPMTISPLARWLINNYDWRPAQLAIGIGVWLVLIPVSFLVRRPPAVAPAPRMEGVPAGGMSVGQALRSPQFAVLALTFFACCATHSGPIFHTVSYAIYCGLPAMTAVTIYSLEGLAGLGGRLLLGLLADRFGVKPVLVAGLAVQAAGAAAYMYARDIDQFYAVALVFGMAYGGVMPLYAVLARDYFGQRIMGSVFGAAAMISSIGMAIGPSLGGWIFDTFQSYNWLYIVSACLGLVAVAIALAFPPQPSRLRPVMG